MLIFAPYRYCSVLYISQIILEKLRSTASSCRPKPGACHFPQQAARPMAHLCLSRFPLAQHERLRRNARIVLCARRRTQIHPLNEQLE